MSKDCEDCKGFSGPPSDIDYKRALKALSEREGMTSEQRNKAKKYLDQIMKGDDGADRL